MYNTAIVGMSSSSPTPESWISSFCSLLGHEYFAEVSEDFIEDDFNLTGLQSQVPMYKEALEMILDVEPEEDDDEDEEEEEEEEEEDDDGTIGDDGIDKAAIGYRRAGDRRHMRMASDLSVVESSAELLYGLIHQRYITSRPGIQQMAEKYEMQHFGLCPRVFCNACKVLPVGTSDTPGQETVKLFCPSCLDVYTPPNSRFQSVDGAFFGTTFGCLFFMTFPELDIGARVDPNSPSPATTTTTNNTKDKSRSSSLASSNAFPGTSPPDLPPNQPSVINGVTPSNLAPGLGPGKIYEPRIYGFRVSERAKSGPRMKWLRMRPVDVNELDESRRWHDVHGDDENGVMDEGSAAQQQQQQQQQPQTQVSRRKKAAVRRRRQVSGSAASAAAGASAGAGNADAMDTNGVGEGG